MRTIALTLILNVLQNLGTKDATKIMKDWIDKDSNIIDQVVGYESRQRSTAKVILLKHSAGGKRGITLALSPQGMNQITRPIATRQESTYQHTTK